MLTFREEKGHPFRVIAFPPNLISHSHRPNLFITPRTNLQINGSKNSQRTIMCVSSLPTYENSTFGIFGHIMHEDMKSA
jgi:hypothetical protein